MARLFGPNLPFVAVIKPLFDCWLGPMDALLERTHYCIGDRSPAGTRAQDCGVKPQWLWDLSLGTEGVCGD